MKPTKDKPIDPPKDAKTTPSKTLPPFSPREAARIWGTWSGNGPPGTRRKYPYSIMD